jgi:hypothetical protein
MRLRYLALAASLLAAAACDRGEPNPLAAPAEPRRESAPGWWWLYDNQEPTEILDATGGWEVSTRFTSAKRGRVLGFHFWRAPGEDGFNYPRLWTDDGTLLAESGHFGSGTGWSTILLAEPVYIDANTPYHVSVNTNVRQAKTGGGYVFYGPLSKGALYSSGGAYGQPAGAFPINPSASYFFIDVVFEEKEWPDLYVSHISPRNSPDTYIEVCNWRGPAGATYTRYEHRQVNPRTGEVVTITPPVEIPTPPLSTNECTRVVPPAPDPSAIGYKHLYEAIVDAHGTVRESNEANNRHTLEWQRYP